MSGSKIDIIILDRKGPDSCEAGCGLDWSKPDNILLAKRQVAERFSREAEIRYVDAAAGLPPDLDQFKDLVLPVLIINGHARVSGLFDMRMLLDAVDTELEISRV